MDPRKENIYISTDVEFDGPNPEINSLRSIGAVAYRENGSEIGRFSVNLHPAAGSAPDYKTMKDFWEKPEQSEAWKALQEAPKAPKEATQAFSDWVSTLTGTPILAAQPLHIEKRWLEHYFERYDVPNPFLGEICMRDVLLKAMEMLDHDEPAPEEWLSKHPYTHIALDDAIHQGETFNNIRQWISARQTEKPLAR